MIERLLAALRLLAAPAAVQRTRLPELVPAPDELAREYADAWLLARQCPGLEISATERELLDRLDEMLDRMTGPSEAHRWTEPAIVSGAEWATIRALAARALERRSEAEGGSHGHGSGSVHRS